jgi:ABC-type sugar transport system ATPase subunit
LLDVVSVTKQFGLVKALDAVSFSVAPGEMVALLGDNGAGKSTLVKCLCGVLAPDAGTIRLGGEPVAFHSPTDAYRAGIGVVFQDLALFDNLPVAANLFAGHELSYPTSPRGLGFLRKRDMNARAREILDRLEVRVPNLRTPAGLLSGGQRQAIAVSKGVAFASQLVILDEPTSALGLRERRNVLNTLRRLPNEGVSVLLISHNLEEVIEIADRAVVLRQGHKVGEIATVPANHEAIVSMIVGGSPAKDGKENGSHVA